MNFKADSFLFDNGPSSNRKDIGIDITSTANNCGDSALKSVLSPQISEVGSPNSARNAPVLMQQQKQQISTITSIPSSSQDATFEAVVGDKKISSHSVVPQIHTQLQQPQ